MGIKKLIKILITLFGLILLISCVNTPKQNYQNSKKENKNKIKIPISPTKNRYLYSILIDKKTKQFVKELLPNESFDTNRYEEIRVYKDGATPSYDIKDINNHQDSIFIDKTFNEIINTLNKNGKNIKNPILYATYFDKKEFLRVANSAIAKMKELEEEKYNKVKFDIDFKIESSIYTEYATATVLIHHKPSLQLNRTIFFINQSGIYANLISQEKITPTLTKHIYKVGLPTGKNQVKVSVSAKDGQEVHKTKMVENIFKGKPTFYIVAIGINDFPKLPIDKKLVNAINDAKYIKDTFQKMSNSLFRGRVEIRPYSLDYKHTTKKNITTIINSIAKDIKPNDYFLLYVASHGFIKGEGENRKYYFAPSDIDINYQNLTFKNGFKEKEISEYLMHIPSIFRFAILDTCHSGKEVDSIKNELRDLPFSKKNGISVLAAAKSTQLANDKYKGHGLFTYVLVEGLKGEADFNQNGVVDSMEIAQYVKNNVTRISKKETNLIQDAVVTPEPTQNYTRRFDLTLLDTKRETKISRPNIFTPRESQLYIDAIKQKDRVMMNGIIRNNTRHNSNNKTEAIDANKITKEQLINKLALLGSVDVNIHFEKNSYKLTKSEISKLEKIAKVLKSQKLKDKHVFIEGHTDSDGDEYFNINLSQQRANSVTDMLIEKFGIDAKRLTSLGFGEIYPVASNKTKEGKAKNRRVTIFIYN